MFKSAIPFLKGLFVSVVEEMHAVSDCWQRTIILGFANWEAEK